MDSERTHVFRGERQQAEMPNNIPKYNIHNQKARCDGTVMRVKLQQGR